MQLRKLLSIVEKFDRGEKVSKMDTRWAIGYIHTLMQKEKRRRTDNLLRSEKLSWQKGQPDDWSPT